jgi:hypothetical protein
MNGRRNEYLDLILKILLDDSIIEQSNGNWWLISPWIQNNDRNYTHVGHFHSILPYTLNSTSEPFGKYCRSNYGLTNNEIYSMWLKYRNELWERYYKLSNNSINESVNRRNEYLDKIVSYLIEDTSYEKDYLFNENGFIVIKFPHVRGFNRYDFEEIEEMGKRSYYMSDDVFDYLYDNYGLVDSESLYVMDTYIKILCEKILDEFKYNTINENIHHDMFGKKISGYMEKILKYLVDDTSFVEDKFFNNPMISVPFSNLQYTRIRYFFRQEFYNYCMNTYGLTKDESIMLWEDYSNEINYILKYEYGVSDPVYS